MGKLIMDKFILEESQLERDIELASLLNVKLIEVLSLGIATPDSIHIHNGKNDLHPSEYIELYKNYEHLNFPAHLRTLMKTSVTSRHKELFALLRTTRNSTCLDFGSGVGSHAIALCQNKNDVSILDVKGKLLTFAIQRLNTRGFYPTIHFSDAILPDNYYNVVICSDTLEHVKSPLNELKRIHKSMKQGGNFHLLVSTMRKPSSGHFNSSIDEWIRYGKQFMVDNFTEIKPTIWRKK